jgi:acyl-CoA reductase-like NAD-dependent aldehyde dehydrogenase
VTRALNSRPAKAQLDLIDGFWSEPAETLPATLDEPNTGEVTQHQAATAARDVGRALACAAGLHNMGTWAWTPLKECAKLLDLFATGLAARAEEVGYEDAMGTGTPLRMATHMARHAVPSVEEALQAAGGRQTGLTGYLFGRDQEAALGTAARVPAGEIRVNGCKLADLADGSEQTFWNAAGIGGHGSTDMVRFFQGRRIIGVDVPALPIQMVNRSGRNVEETTTVPCWRAGEKIPSVQHGTPSV